MKGKDLMESFPTNPIGGARQQRAAQLRAEMEAKKREQQIPAGPPEDEAERVEDEQVIDESQEQGIGPVGQGDHVVKEGNCISSIAKETGHFWETIWNDPANAELTDVRKDPNVLLAEDRVTIPELRRKEESGETEMRHRFVRRGEPAFVRLRVLDRDRPVANQPYTLVIDGRTFEGTTDADGKLEVGIPGDAERGKLQVGVEPEVYEYELVLGDIDPIHEVAGVKQRLSNLGFGCGDAGDRAGPEFKAAVRAFQSRKGIAETGQMDEATRAALLDEHGS